MKALNNKKEEDPPQTEAQLTNALLDAIEEEKDLSKSGDDQPLFLVQSMPKGCPLRDEDYMKKN